MSRVNQMLLGSVLSAQLLLIGVGPVAADESEMQARPRELLLEPSPAPAREEAQPATPADVKVPEQAQEQTREQTQVQPQAQVQAQEQLPEPAPLHATAPVSEQVTEQAGKQEVGQVDRPADAPASARVNDRADEQESARASAIWDDDEDLDMSFQEREAQSGGQQTSPSNETRAAVVQQPKDEDEPVAKPESTVGSNENREVSSPAVAQANTSPSDARETDSKAIDPPATPGATVTLDPAMSPAEE
jgi:hypothetical protein